MGSDICERKHGGAETSAIAYAKSKRNVSLWHNRILAALGDAENGITLKEFCDIYGEPLNKISGRFSELQAWNAICKCGERRNGCAVWRVRKINHEAGF